MNIEICNNETQYQVQSCRRAEKNFKKINQTHLIRINQQNNKEQTLIY